MSESLLRLARRFCILAVTSTLGLACQTGQEAQDSGETDLGPGGGETNHSNDSGSSTGHPNAEAEGEATNGGDEVEDTGSTPTSTATETTTSGMTVGTTDPDSHDATATMGDMETTDDGDDLYCQPGVFPEQCPDNYKCSPAKASPQDSIITTATCIPITGELGLGDICTRDGDTPADDCAQRFWCFAGTSGASGPGHCQPLCDTDRAAESCGEDFGLSTHYCMAYNDGYVPTCVRRCNPLLQDCPVLSQGCFAEEDDPAFVCQSLGSNGNWAGDPCTTANSCAQGLGCVSAHRLVDCDAERCCTHLCDLEDDDPDDACGGPGESCIPWAPPPVGVDTIGFCGLE